eukprot:7834886-Pyramimonas_sp.AAC.1
MANTACPRDVVGGGLVVSGRVAEGQNEDDVVERNPEELLGVLVQVVDVVGGVGLPPVLHLGWGT